MPTPFSTNAASESRTLLAQADEIFPPLLIHTNLPPDAGIPKVSGKVPGHWDGYRWQLSDAWQFGSIVERKAASAAHDPNIGLLMGKVSQGVQFVGFDFDFTPVDGEPGHPQSVMANKASRLAVRTLAEHLGKPVWTRFTKPGRAYVLCRIDPAAAAGAKERILLKHPSGMKIGVIEILATGNQTNIGGRYGSNLTPITWSRSDKPDEKFNFPNPLECHEFPSRGDLGLALLAVTTALADDLDITVESRKLGRLPQHGEAENVTLLDPEEIKSPGTDRLLTLFGHLPATSEVSRDDRLSIGLAVLNCIRVEEAQGTITAVQKDRIRDEYADWCMRWGNPGATVYDREYYLKCWDDDVRKAPPCATGGPRITQHAKRLGMTAWLTEADLDIEAEHRRNYHLHAFGAPEPLTAAELAKHAILKYLNDNPAFTREDLETAIIMDCEFEVVEWFFSHSHEVDEFCRDFERKARFKREAEIAEIENLIDEQAESKAAVEDTKANLLSCKEKLQNALEETKSLQVESLRTDLTAEERISAKAAFDHQKAQTELLRLQTRKAEEAYVKARKADKCVKNWMQIELANSFADDFYSKYHFDHTAKRWMRFDETSYWLPDHRNSVFHTAANFLTECAHSPDWIGVRKGHGQTGFTQGVIDAAKSNPLMAKYSIDYNQDNMIAGFPGGYIDLRTCEIHKPDPALMIRNGLDVAPSASGKKPMRWLKFMEEITCGDVDLANWLQKFCGYCLTGMVDEQVIVYFFGNGRNGKSVFTTILTQILGNFAFAAPIEMLDRNVSLNREAQLARMEGVRLAFFNEPGENVKWKESLVKSMTGQDGKVSARALYGQPIDYVATYKVLVVGNYKPFLSGAEESMIGRFRLVPFKFTAKNPDLNLRANLAAEIPEILNWMIEGCKKWQSEGLGTCDAIKNASAEFFTDQDRIGTWLTERCVIDPKAECRSGDVMDLFNAFLAQDHDPLVNAREIKNLLQKKGFEYAKDKRGRLYRGFRLKTNKELEDEGNKPKPEFSVDNNVVDFDQFRAA